MPLPKVSFADDDKFFRCPRRGRGCQNGYLGEHSKVPHWEWRTTRCPECGVLVLPYMAKWVNPSWLRYYLFRRLPGRVGDWWWEFNYRRGRR